MSKPAKNEITLLCPAEETWELWRQQGGGPFQKVGTVAPSADTIVESTRDAQVFGLAVRAAFSVAFWVPSVDQEIIDNAIDLQLEKLNLKADGVAGRMIETTNLEQEEGQTLAFATVLSDRQVKAFPTGAIPTQFEVTPFLFYLPENAIVLWKELGQIVAVVTRADKPVHFQTLAAAEVDASVVHELQLLLMQLDLQNLTPALERIVLWTDAVAPDAETQLREAFGLSVSRQAKPAPALPPQPSSLLPPLVAAARAAAARAARIRRIVGAVAAVYLAIAGTYGFFTFKEMRAASTLKSQQRGLEASAGWVDAERARWFRMLDVTHGDRYPLERFLQTTKQLDERAQVKLTKFAFEPTRIVISAEAKDVPRANNYKNLLIRDPSLSEYQWDSTPPRGEKNGYSSFQIVGTLKNAISDAQ